MLQLVYLSADGHLCWNRLGQRGWAPPCSLTAEHTPLPTSLGPTEQEQSLVLGNKDSNDGDDDAGTLALIRHFLYARHGVRPFNLPPAIPTSPWEVGSVRILWMGTYAQRPGYLPKGTQLNRLRRIF